VKTACDAPTGELSRQARTRMSRPLFHADWLDVVFLHYEVEAAVLQPVVPFELHLWEEKAYVSLVTFVMRELRSPYLPHAAKWLLRPISNHFFLNARTYVQAGGETGIYFLAEWLSRRFPVPLGRPLFGLPYHFGEFDSRRENITARGGSLRFSANREETAHPAPCKAGSLDEFLLERYTAFTQWRGLRRFFRIWHPPWPVAPLSATVTDTSLLAPTGNWIHHARLIAAHSSPGVPGVWMGRPRFL
jgi:uncharacterized protein